MTCASSASIETHTHADHLSGHGRLALEHGVPVSVHPTAGAEYPHDPMEDGDEIALGDIVLRCIHTPGHRPEHCCLAVSDLTRGPDPWIVLTGDSLFVGDAARPDLAVEGTRGRRRPLPLAPTPRRARRRRRGLSRPRRGIALRKGDELEGVDDDRLRAAVQSRACRPTTSRSSSPSPQGSLRHALRTWSTSSR